MRLSKRPFITLLLTLGLLSGLPVAAQGSYPAKPITLVVPFPAGGATDIFARALATKLGEKLGKPVVVENRAGGGTMVGAGHVAAATPDGYTLLISSGSTFTLNPAIRSKLPYDPVQSFEPIGIAARLTVVLLANKDAGVSDIKQLVTTAKAAPMKYAYGSFGSGTTSQFVGEMFFYEAGIKLRHVPYKGSAPALEDLMAGQIPFSVDTLAASLQLIQDGKVKALAVSSRKRSPLLPKVPTLMESGYPTVEMDSWLGLVGPRGLPSGVKSLLELALAQVVSDVQMRDQLVGMGFEPAYGSSKALADLIDKELPKVRAIAQRANITAE